jgi:hypothetical protein
VGVLVISDAFEFTWRYQLPALVTLPPAAALGLTALFTHRHHATARQPSPAPATEDRALHPAGHSATVTRPTATAEPVASAEPAGDGQPTAEGGGQPGPQTRDRTPAG